MGKREGKRRWLEGKVREDEEENDRLDNFLIMGRERESRDLRERRKGRRNSERKCVEEENRKIGRARKCSREGQEEEKMVFP